MADDRLRCTVQDVGTQAAVILLSELAAGDQVDGDMMFKQGDIAALADLAKQGRFHGATGGVGGVHDPSGGMTAFAGQVEVISVAGIVVAGKWHAEIDQPVDGFRPFFDGEADGLRVVQAGTGIEGVSNV